MSEGPHRCRATRGGSCPARVGALLAAGADPNQRIERGRKTALHRLAEEGNEAGVRFLLGNRADPSARDYRDRTPADLAEEAGHPGLARVLRSGS